MLLGLLASCVRSTACSARRVVAKERQRAQFAEARLRAEAAEALARAESEGKKNVELLSEMGREITASLDFDTIFGKLYEQRERARRRRRVRRRAVSPRRHEIEYRLAIEKGKRYAPYTRDTTDHEPASGLVHRAPRAGLHQRPRRPSTSRYISTLRRRRASRSRTARCRSSRSR